MRPLRTVPGSAVLGSMDLERLSSCLKEASVLCVMLT